ncbi:MAB_1171c family putative transporter [Streptomyces tsukubensis]|uniref:DUF6545 domain-containing protein n=1 Tax=Streptomyces tsukubensis TaxID=83656 RepID=A0A1V4A291_9ACTN|nr:MAB_1171c family putative transporter [Streptomyces tsukubensis]OON74028.1 hypothetical protein B1H18_26320 [Streptomyces tsukubensis]QFR92925.1 hypothetical protein GBW32_07375 [Streptomyces tsukubensis]
MTNPWYLVGSLACWIAFVCTLMPLLRGYRRDPAVIALCAAFGSQAMYLLLSVPKHWTGTLFGTVTWYNVSVQMWMIATLVCQQVLLIHWTHPITLARKLALRRMLVVACVPAMMAALFLCATLQGSPHNSFIDLPGYRPSDQPFFVAYQVVYLTALAAGKVLVARACWAFARQSELYTRQDGLYERQHEGIWLRRGLRTAAAGAVVELVYPLGRFADVFLASHGWNSAQWAVVSRGSLTVGMVLNILGWTAPLWGARVSAALAWCRAYRDYRRLRPLWCALHRAYPRILLQPPLAHDIAAVRDLRFHLHRRVIEIRDGYLALEGVAGTAEGLRDGRRVELEAAWIATALATRSPGETGSAEGTETRSTPADARPVGVPDGPGPTSSAGIQDFPADVAWLTEVSRAYARSHA